MTLLIACTMMLDICVFEQPQARFNLRINCLIERAAREETARQNKQPVPVLKCIKK